MSIGISDEHVELGESLRKWAASVGGVEAVRDADEDPGARFEDAWRAVAEMGIAAIAAPESAGGGGGTVLDQAVALEACAHELVPGALFGPAVASTLLGGVEVDLPADAVVGLALDPSLQVVWDAPSATHLLVPGAGDDWFLGPTSAATVTPVVGLDLSRRCGSATLDLDGSGAVPVPGRTTALVRRTAVTYAAAEAAGVARWCLGTAVEYAKVREQFGRPIGSFQAVKHLCAEMLETSEAVTAAAWDAAAAASGATDEQGDEQWAFAADVASVQAFDGAVEVANA